MSVRSSVEVVTRASSRLPFSWAVSLVAKVLVTVLGATFVTFFILNALPGNVAVSILGINATPEAIADLSEQLRLDDPFFTRYMEWLTSAVRGDLGNSLLSGQPVWHLISERIAVTLQLFALALFLSIAPAFGLAAAAAVRPGGFADRALSVVCTVAMAVPEFVLGLLLVLVFAVTIPLLPPSGYVSFSEDPLGALKALLMPATALAATRFAVHARMLRAELVSKISLQEYMLTARAKGLSQRQAVWRHGVRNGAFAVVPVIGVNISPLLGGAVVIEPLFGLPGMGDLLVSSIFNRDAPVVQAAVVGFAIISVSGNLLAEVAGRWLDPRIRVRGEQ